MKRLTTKEQIKVLKLAKRLYVEQYAEDRLGMCAAIRNSIDKLFDEFVGYYELEYIIPCFDKIALRAASRKRLIPKMDKNIMFYYWDRNDVTIRPRVFDYLIDKLEKKIYTSKN